MKKIRSSKIMQIGEIGSDFVFAVLAILIVAGMAVVGGLPSMVSPQSGKQVQIITTPTNQSHNSLQLETFGYTTIVPSVPVRLATNANPKTIAAPPPINTVHNTPSNLPYCYQVDDGIKKPTTCQCAGETMECVNGQTKYISGAHFTVNPCGKPPYSNGGSYCIGKPVIYLYPKNPTYVNVQVVTKGKIVVSNPMYPQKGWKNILANPNGTLYYRKQKYKELFYESSVNSFQKPYEGIVIPTSELTSRLNSLLSRLGLITNEKKEFISFWVPKLQALNAPYIFFSILSPSAKEAVDHVIITPKPETQIAFIAYFKPLDTAIYGSPLHLPPTPKRIGFTSVEWGGVIDY